MAKVEIKVSCILNWNSDYARMLVMQTMDNQTSFPIIIAENEAICLLKELEKMKTQRPLTHDLLFATLQSFDIQIKEVYIHNIVEGIFYTQIRYEKDNEYVEVDARPSDAIILAIKSKAPMFVEESILDKLGKNIEILPPTLSDNQETEEDLAMLSREDLEKKLLQAVEIEDFETASKIRDALKIMNNE
jgi:bifunctional DNase/RNase